MALITRRFALAAGGTLTAALIARKPRAEALPDPGSVLVLTDPPVAAPDIGFVSADGTPHRLAEFAGHGMLINLWATWCAPCVAEMPALAVLSKALAPDDIAVLPLSSDRGGAPVVAMFFHEHGIAALPVLLDPKGAAAHTLHARGIPMSVIIDRKGWVRARAEGPADWSTPAAAELVRRLAGG